MEVAPSVSRPRVGVDIGGTFTDCLLSTPNGLAWAKIPTTPEAPEEAALHAFENALEQMGVSPAEVSTFVHGTTLALNTLLERSGASIGVLVTRGFKNTLELGRLRLSSINDYLALRPDPLVSSRYILEVDERILASGDVFRPLDAVEARCAVERLIRAGAGAIAVCFINAFRNPAHEQAAVAIVRELAPEAFVCASSDVWRERGEYERFITAVINAYVGPKMRGYLARFDRSLGKYGFRGQLLLTKSNGGVTTARAAGERPVATLLSGPAAGVVGAWRISERAGLRRVIAFDMGGTSADISVLSAGIPYSYESEVAGLPVLLPSVDTYSIGAGGGSIAKLDSVGVLKVGPRSAGSVPGPVCYGLGGTEPTLTDSYLTAGIIGADSFLGGKMRLDLAAARKSLSQQLHGTPETASGWVIDVATATMHSRFAPYLARLGIDPTDFALLAYGGAGPTHSFLIAGELGIPRVVVPPRPGLLCAYGCLSADLRTDHVATMAIELAASSRLILTSTALSLQAEAEEMVANELGVPYRFGFWTAEMRYRGQTAAVSVSMPQSAITEPEEMMGRFHRRYSEIYGQSYPGFPVELTNLRLQTMVPVPGTEVQEDFGHLRGGEREGIRRRRICVKGETADAKVVWRWALDPGAEMAGPAVIEQEDSTVLVPQGWHVVVDSQFNLIGSQE